MQVATLTKIVDERNIRANQQHISHGSEQRRCDCQRSQRYAQRQKHRRHAYSRGRCYGCGKLGHIRRECTRFAREQSREHVGASRYSGNIQQSRTLGEKARAVENYPNTKRIVAFQQGAHVQCDLQRDSEMDHEKGSRRATRESRSGESCAVSRSERRHLWAEKHNTPIGASVSLDKQTRVSRHTQTPIIQDALPVVSVSPRSYPDRPHNVADETSREDPVKHDLVDVDGGHKTSDERPKTVRSMLPRKARHDANVTECTLAIGDFVFIRDRTSRGRNEIHVCLFIRDPVGPMVQHYLQEQYMHTSQVAHRQCLLTLSHSLAWAHHQQCIHAGQPDQLTRGPHSQHEVRRLNTNKPHSDATTTRQTTHGQRQTMCRSHSPPTSPTATLPQQEYRTPFIWIQRDPIHVEYYRIRSRVRSICWKQRVRRYAGNRRTKEDIESCFFAARPSSGDRYRPLYTRRQLVRRCRYYACARNSQSCGYAGQRKHCRSGANTEQACRLAVVISWIT